MTTKLTALLIHTEKYLPKISKDLTCEVLAIFKGDHSFSTYAKFSKKTKISYLLIRTQKRAYQGIRNVVFSGNIVYVLKE